MWWLVGLLAALAAASSNTSRNLLVNGASRLSESESRPPGLLPYIPGTLVYYSLDGTAAFRFKFEIQPSDGIRIYVLEQPGYRGRSEASIPTHRIFDQGRTFICFDPLPQTTEEARKIARAWAELTLRYIRTGERF